MSSSDSGPPRAAVVSMNLMVCEVSSRGPYKSILSSYSNSLDIHSFQSFFTVVAKGKFSREGFRESRMVNDTQSFSQYKDKAHAISTESIQRVIGAESYQPKLVQNWVDSVGQDIVNKLRVR